MTEETYILALEKAKRDLRERKPNSIAKFSGVQYIQGSVNNGQFRLKFIGRDYIIDYPSGLVNEQGSTGKESISVIIVILHYLITADGTVTSNLWIPYRKLPGGRAFAPAFHRLACQPLVRIFGNDINSFMKAAESLGGNSLDFGDASFSFQVFPNQQVAIILHQAIEEYPASVNIFFDETAKHYLPTEDWSVVGSILSHRMLKIKEKENEG